MIPLNIMGFMNFLFISVWLWSSWCFAGTDLDARLADYGKGAQETFLYIASKASSIAKLDILDKNFKQLKSMHNRDSDDFLAASYAGLYAAWRCRETKDLVKLNGFAQESIPLLDEGVNKAKRAGHSKALLAALKNRLEIYTNLPSAFGKNYIAKQDIELALQELAKVNPSDQEKIQFELLAIRVLAITDRVDEAKKRLEKLKKDKKFDAAAMAFELSTAQDILVKNAEKK
jgi:hypothetical protein